MRVMWQTGPGLSKDAPVGGVPAIGWMNVSILNPLYACGKRLASSFAGKKPVFSFIVADFLNPPVVDEIDLTGFAGRIGDVIKIRAHDDFEVSGVNVLPRDPSGFAHETGAATLSTTDGAWHHTLTTNLPAGTPTVIDVTATDRPAASHRRMTFPMGIHQVGV